MNRKSNSLRISGLCGRSKVTITTLLVLLNDIVYSCNVVYYHLCVVKYKIYMILEGIQTLIRLFSQPL